MITFEEGKRKEVTVKIPRIKCRCGHTHAIIPEILIPYGSYSLRFILIVLYRYVSKRCTIAELCEECQISVSTLYSWIHLFIEQYNLISGVLKEIRSISRGSVLTVFNSQSFTKDFFMRFGVSFMQRFRVLTTTSDP